MTEDILARPVDVKDKPVNIIESEPRIVVGESEKSVLPPQEFEYASFWIRLGARAIDFVIVAIIMLTSSLLIFPLLMSSADITKSKNYASTTYSVRLVALIEQNNLSIGDLLNGKAINDCGFLFDGGESRTLCEEVNKIDLKTNLINSSFSFLLVIVYYLLPSITLWQGSIGKKLLKLKITNFSGQKINLLQSFAREVFNLLGAVGSIVSLFYFQLWPLLLILSLVGIVDGLKIFFDEKRKSLHDDIAQTYVLKITDNL